MQRLSSTQEARVSNPPFLLQTVASTRGPKYLHTVSGILSGGVAGAHGILSEAHGILSEAQDRALRTILRYARCFAPQDASLRTMLRSTRCFAQHDASLRSA